MGLHADGNGQHDGNEDAHHGNGGAQPGHEVGRAVEELPGPHGRERDRSPEDDATEPRPPAQGPQLHRSGAHERGDCRSHGDRVIAVNDSGHEAEHD